MAGPRQTLTVVIPTKDVADLIEDCLASVAWADEILVIDMFSTDGTQEICARRERCRVIERDDYIFGNVNHGIDQASSDWILRLDSDERITPELAAEIQAILADPPAELIGFRCWERPFVLGHELRHGFGRRHHRRLLFRRGAARYAVQREHEDLTSEGAWGTTAHGYIHLNYRSVGQDLRKMDYYVDKDLDRTELPAELPRPTRGLIEAARAFYLYYGKHQGFRDGWPGLLDASMRAIYQWVAYAKLRERWEAQRRG
jgi:glycosyltransferase involved in cell wall biosynthesis